MRKNEPFIFSDGAHQLCIRDMNSDEVLALDEQGILFVYSEAPHILELLERNGFENRKEELLYDVPHLHIWTQESRELAEKLIEALNLERVGSMVEFNRVIHQLLWRTKQLIFRNR